MTNRKRKDRPRGIRSVFTAHINGDGQMLSARMRLPMERFTRQKLESMAPSALPKRSGEILLRISVAFEHVQARRIFVSSRFHAVPSTSIEELNLSSPSIYYSIYFQGGFPPVCMQISCAMHIVIPRLTHRIAA